MSQPANPNLLFEVAEDLLNAAGDVLDASSDPDGAPERRFVAMGAPVADCRGGQLTVHLSPLKTMATRQLPNARTCNIATVGVFTITLIRCAVGPGTSGGIPTAAMLHAEAGRAYEDAWRIWAGL